MFGRRGYMFGRRGYVWKEGICLEGGDMFGKRRYVWKEGICLEGGCVFGRSVCLQRLIDIKFVCRILPVTLNE